MTDIRKNCRLTDVKRELIGAMFRYSSQNPRCQDTKKDVGVCSFAYPFIRPSYCLSKLRSLMKEDKRQVTSSYLTLAYIMDEQS